MLTVTGPLHLRSGGVLPILTDALGEKIRKGYGLAAVRSPAEELVFLIPFPPEPPQAARDITAFLMNSRCTGSASLVLNMAAHVVNRIVAAGTGWVTRRDQTRVFSVSGRPAAGGTARRWMRAQVSRPVERQVFLPAPPSLPGLRRLTEGTGAGVFPPPLSPKLPAGEKVFRLALRPVPDTNRFVLRGPDVGCLLREVFRVLRRPQFRLSGERLDGALSIAVCLPAGSVLYPAAAPRSRRGAAYPAPDRTAGRLPADLPVFLKYGDHPPARSVPEAVFHRRSNVPGRPAVLVRNRLRLRLNPGASPGAALSEIRENTASRSGAAYSCAASAVPPPPACAAEIRRLALRERSLDRGRLLRSFPAQPGKTGQSAAGIWTAPTAFAFPFTMRTERLSPERPAVFGMRRTCVKTAVRQETNCRRFEGFRIFRSLVRKEGIPASGVSDVPRRDLNPSVRASPGGTPGHRPPLLSGSRPAAGAGVPAALSDPAPRPSSIRLHAVEAAGLSTVRETVRQSRESFLRLCTLASERSPRTAARLAPERQDFRALRIRGAAAPDAGAEAPPAPAGTEAGSGALLERLAEIDRRNRMLMKTVQEAWRQNTSVVFRGADIPRTLRESLRILETPEPLWREPSPPAGAERVQSPRPAPWEEVVLRAADPAVRTLYGALLACRENPKQIVGRGLLRPAGTAALQSALRNAAAPPEREAAGIPGRFASSGAFLTETAALPAAPRQMPASRPTSPAPPETRRERVSIVHRQTVPGVAREFSENSEQQGLKAPLRMETSEETLRGEKYRTEWSGIRLETGTQATEDISDLVRRTVARQMRSISDQVYRQMERRLQSEQARRGRF